MQETYPFNAEGKVNGRILLTVEFVQWVGFLFFMVWGVVPRSPLYIVIENFDYLKCVLVLLIFMNTQGWKHWRTSDIRQTTYPWNERNIPSLKCHTYPKIVLVLLIPMNIQGQKDWRTSGCRRQSYPLHHRNIFVIEVSKKILNVYWYYYSYEHTGLEGLEN